MSPETVENFDVPVVRHLCTGKYYSPVTTDFFSNFVALCRTRLCEVREKDVQAGLTTRIEERRLRARQLSGLSMSFEIERKFLVVGQDWQRLAIRRSHIRQAYLAAEGALSIRVRIQDDHDATLTIKSRGAELRRLELEYPIPVTDAEALMARRQGAVIEKIRHEVPWQGLMWEIDVFGGENEGLLLAELELDHERQPFELPPWIGTEVTSLRRYYNGDLAQRPFRQWEASAVVNVA